MREETRINTIINSLTLLLIAASLLGACSLSDTGPKIEIDSYVVRDRVIPLDEIDIRSQMIVAFRIRPPLSKLDGQTLSGELYHDNELIAEDTVPYLGSSEGNIGFDIALSNGPFDREKAYGIPEGTYSIILTLFDENARPIARCEKELKRKQIGRVFAGLDALHTPPRYALAGDDSERTTPAPEQSGLNMPDGADYLIFQRSTLQRVYQSDKPCVTELISELSSEVARNESQSLSFSIRALKALGKVKVAVSPLLNSQDISSSVSAEVGAVGLLSEIQENQGTDKTIHYHQAPRIVETGDVRLGSSQTQTYWIWLKADSNSVPGDYNGIITIIPENGVQTEIPLCVKVLPLELTDTDIQYGMMMTYAFYELDNPPWTEQQKTLIRQRGAEVYRDLREHGMTAICAHSHFYYKVDTRGRPNLDSLKASLEAYKTLDFPGPFCWYIGNLLQTAKPKHPGSILNYDREIASKRLRDLLREYELAAEQLGIPRERLMVHLVDEPDSPERVKAAEELYQLAGQLGFKTLITSFWIVADVICTGVPKNDLEAEKQRSMGTQWWIYPNEALTSKNLCYARYVFGFGAWKWGVNGVVPWTFQMSQGSNGNPFTVLDGPEVMVTYPGIPAPIPTPSWEVIRDGINDYKYLYLLERLICSAKAGGHPSAALIERQLQQFKRALGQGPGAGEGQFNDWPPESFAKRRKQIIEWAIELHQSTSGMSE